MECIKGIASATITPLGETGELITQVIEKERAYHLHDVLLCCIVCSLCPPLISIHDGLKKRAEYGGRDGIPVEVARLDEKSAHGGVKCRGWEPLGKEVAIHIGKLGQVFI